MHICYPCYPYLVAWVPGYRHRHFSLLARNNVFPLKKDGKQKSIFETKVKLEKVSDVALAFKPCCKLWQDYTHAWVFHGGTMTSLRSLCPGKSCTAADPNWGTEHCVRFNVLIVTSAFGFLWKQGEAFISVNTTWQEQRRHRVCFARRTTLTLATADTHTCSKTHQRSDKSLQH